MRVMLQKVVIQTSIIFLQRLKDAYSNLMVYLQALIQEDPIWKSLENDSFFLRGYLEWYDSKVSQEND